MSERDDRLPERLSAQGGTSLERRLLGAAARERPTRAASERMARAIGVAPPVITGAESASGGADTVAPPTAAASAGALPWIAGALITVTVGGAVLALRPGPEPAATLRKPAPAITQPSLPEASRMVTAPAPPATAADATPTDPTPPRARPSASASALAEQIALLDAARGAMAAGASERALETLQRYLAKYPAGSFRPEATALKIETLVRMGRTKEARSLADRFVADHKGTPLARRVSELTRATPR